MPIAVSEPVMKFLKIHSISRSLASHQPEIVERQSHTKHAAVAAILRTTNEHTEALFILRATKEGDPWSGQMAFPGGHYEVDDESLKATAERETLEEIGLDLVKEATYLGKIPDVEANPRGRNLNMVVSPFVYVLENRNAVMNLNYEVEEVLWGSLNDMYFGNSATSYRFRLAGKEQDFPGYHVGNQVVWGLTHKMLDHFFRLLDPDWQPKYE